MDQCYSGGEGGEQGWADHLSVTAWALEETGEAPQQSQHPDGDVLDLRGHPGGQGAVQSKERSGMN